VTSPPGKTFHIPALDGIRAVSIAIVFVAHAGLGSVVPGGFGVTVFFFLSGFLISTLLRKEFAKQQSISFKNFYIRRALRIFPPFYSALAFAVLILMAGLLPGKVAWSGVGLLAGHLGNYAQVYWGEAALPPGTAVYWSLAVEEHYYLTFPFVALLLLKRNSKATTVVTLTLIGIAILLWRIYLVNQGAPEVRTYLATDTRVDSILWGCLLAMTLNPVMDKPLATSTAVEALVLLLSLGVLFFCFVYREGAFRETFRYTLQGIALLPVFYLAVLRSHWPVFRWLDWRPIRYIGTLSYTLYLVHLVVLYSLEYCLPQVPGVVRGIAGAALSTGIAALSYHYMERPLARLRKKYSE